MRQTNIDADITMPSMASQAELAHIEMDSGKTDCGKENYTSTGIFSTKFANAGWGWLLTPGCALLTDSKRVLQPPRVVGGMGA